MTATATRLFVVLLALGAAPCADAAAQARPDSNPQERPSQTTPEQMPLDMARIRKLLGGRSSPRSERLLAGFAEMKKVEVHFIPRPVRVDDNSNGMPKFEDKVDVIAFRWDAPTLGQQLDALEKQSRYPYIYAPSLQELSLRAPELQYLHPVNAVMAANKAIRGALYRRNVNKTRREVEAELQAVNAHNAAVAAAADSKPPKKQQ